MLKLPAASGGVSEPAASGYVPKPKGAYIASAPLEASALQDFVDALPDLVKAAAGLALGFHLQISLGEGENIDVSKLEKINAILETVNAGLRLKR